MRFNQMFDMYLCEEYVSSSWIFDLTYSKEHGGVIMTLLSGRQYLINGVDEDTYQQWIAAASKGKFWHSDIVGNYAVDRIAINVPLRRKRLGSKTRAGRTKSRGRPNLRRKQPPTDQ